MNQNFLSISDFIKYFFERRIKRLLPALLFYVISVSLIICLFNPYPNVSIRTGFFSLLGLSNFYLFKYSTDYFAQASYLNPFIYFNQEEQFYLIFIFHITKKGRKIIQIISNNLYSFYFSLIYF